MGVLRCAGAPRMGVLRCAGAPRMGDIVCAHPRSLFCLPLHLNSAHPFFNLFLLFLLPILLPLSPPAIPPSPASFPFTHFSFILSIFLIISFIRFFYFIPRKSRDPLFSVSPPFDSQIFQFNSSSSSSHSVSFSLILTCLSPISISFLQPFHFLSCSSLLLSFLFFSAPTFTLSPTLRHIYIPFPGN
jgi:hypothetical protein